MATFTDGAWHWREMGSLQRVWMALPVGVACLGGDLGVCGGQLVSQIRGGSHQAWGPPAA